MSAAGNIAAVGGGFKNVAVGLAIFAALAGVAYLIYKRKELLDAINPASDKNLAYQGANKVTQIVTGDANTSVGSKAYDVIDTIKGWLPGVQSDEERAADVAAKIAERTTLIRATKMYQLD